MSISQYHQNSSDIELWKSAIGKITRGLDFWLQTDVKKQSRLEELAVAHDLVLVFLDNIDSSHEYGLILHKIFNKISWDIIEAQSNKKDFQEVQKNFKEDIAALSFIMKII